MAGEHPDAPRCFGAADEVDACRLESGDVALGFGVSTWADATFAIHRTAALATQFTHSVVGSNDTRRNPAMKIAPS